MGDNVPPPIQVPDLYSIGRYPTDAETLLRLMFDKPIREVCPDCDSTSYLRCDAAEGVHLDIGHSPGCPLATQAFWGGGSDGR